MPQTERDEYSGFWVKIRTKYCGTKRDSRNINVVKPMHKSRTQSTILRMRSTFPAPMLKLMRGWEPPVMPSIGEVMSSM
ncbi:Uncharacterised protein [uncultured Clostridium sp.]|nr:Uncharacterised protein [uncultured Clostridium sp.]